MRTTSRFFVCRPYHVRVKPSRRASDRTPFKRVRTPHARSSVLKEPRQKKVRAQTPMLTGRPDLSQGGLPLEDTTPPGSRPRCPGSGVRGEVSGVPVTGTRDPPKWIAS